jgi:hypothetical protein
MNIVRCHDAGGMAGTAYVGMMKESRRLHHYVAHAQGHAKTNSHVTP